MQTEQTRGKAEVSIVRELDLGEHTLFIMSDNSIDIMDLSGEPWSYLADNGLRLNSDETYKLFISLQDMYR